tara:strand:+ start:133 stop:273 length:141 start_codon:yes stop_codon:yes gene_type:complete
MYFSCNLKITDAIAKLIKIENNKTHKSFQSQKPKKIKDETISKIIK